MTGSLSLFDDPQYQRPERMRAYSPVYYGTVQWRMRANQRKSQDRYVCQGYRCPSRGKPGVKLHVHHLTREHQGYELPSDLVSLCSDCHQEWEALGFVA
jgi:HNH endonuclease